MGLDPVRFLVVTRVMAAVMMMPLLTIFSNLMGLVGGAVVFLSFDFPLVTYVQQVRGAVELSDLLAVWPRLLSSASSWPPSVACEACKPRPELAPSGYPPLAPWSAASYSLCWPMECSPSCSTTWVFRGYGHRERSDHLRGTFHGGL